MRRFVLLTVALSLVVLAALAPAASAGGACDPYTQGSWALKTPVNTTAVRAWGSFFPGNGNFYVLGGRPDDTGNELVNPREFNPGTNTWTTKPSSFPNTKVNNMVGGILNFGGTNIITVVGGSDVLSQTATSDVRGYNPITDTLTTLGPADNWPQNGNGITLPGGAAVFNNKLYVFGGFEIGIGMISTIWEFNPAAAPGARWTLKTATLPAPRGYIPAAEAGGFIYLVGGAEFVAGALNDTNTSLRYDPTADVITTIATTPRAVGETRAVRQPLDNTIWVLGGGRTAPNPSAQVDVYNPATNTWSTAPSLLNARRNIAADIDPVDGRIWAAGGYDVDGVTPLNVNEQFTCTVPVDLMTFGVE